MSWKCHFLSGTFTTIEHFAQSPMMTLQMATYFLILLLLLGFPLCISSFFSSHNFLAFLLVLVLHFFYISVAFLSYMFNSLSACAACLDRILRLTASRDESAGCTNFPHWTLASSLLVVCICPSCKMYLSVKPNLFVQIWCYKQIKKYPKKILYSDSLAHICSFLGNVLRTLTKEIWNQFKYEFVAYQVFVQH